MSPISSVVQDTGAEAYITAHLINTISLAITVFSVLLLHVRVKNLESHSAPRPRDPLDIKSEHLMRVSELLPSLQDQVACNTAAGEISPASRDLVYKIIPQEILVCQLQLLLARYGTERTLQISKLDEGISELDRDVEKAIADVTPAHKSND